MSAAARDGVLSEGRCSTPPARQARPPRARESAAEFRERCRGRWPQIFQALGVPERFLNGRNQPCPICGGKDRARFTDHERLGRVICGHCMPPEECIDGFEFLGRLRSQSFAEVCSDIRAVLGDLPAAPKREPGIASIRGAIRDVWRESVPIADGDPVQRYLRARGLPGFVSPPEFVRHHPNLRHWDGKRETHHPAMVAMVFDTEGRCRTLHRTFLTLSGAKAAVTPARQYMPVVGGWHGGGVRLHAGSDGPVVVCEGIETTLALWERAGASTPYAALDAAHLETFDPPEGRHVVIGADADKSGRGQLAAYRLAERLARRGQTWEVCMPPVLGTDWLDHLPQQGRAA